MKILLLSLLLISCSSSPKEQTEEPPITEEGTLDKALKNKECGIFDLMYDGCKKKEFSND